MSVLGNMMGRRNDRNKGGTGTGDAASAGGHGAVPAMHHRTTEHKPSAVVLRDAIIKARAERVRPSLSDVVRLAKEKRYQPERKYKPEEIASMGGIDFQLLLHAQEVEHFVFDGEGLEALRQWADNPSLAIDLRGSTLGGCVVTPESGFPGITVSNRIQPHEGVILDHDTNIKGLIFEGFNLPATMHFSHANLEMVEFKGLRQKGPVQTGMHFRECTITGMNISGAKLANLTLEHCTLNFARLDDVSVIMIHANQSSMQGAQFNRASFGPDSRMVHTDCSCADFSEAVLDNLDLSHSTLYGVNLDGVDISRVNLSGAAIDPESLIGAIGPDGPIQTVEQALAYMAARGMKRTSPHASNHIANVQSQAQRYQTMRRKAIDQVVQNKVAEKRSMDVALCEVYKQMHEGSIARSVGVAQPANSVNITQNSLATGRYKVDHSEEYTRGRPPLG